MKYNFDEIIDRTNDQYSYSLKWSNLKDKDYICLQTADMDFKTAPEVIEAMHKVADHGVYGYSGINDEYRNAHVNWFASRHNWHFNKEDLYFVCGTHTGVVECIKRFTKEDDGIIVLLPSYSYHHDIEPYNRRYVGVEMKEDNGYYTIDFEALEKAASDPKTTMFIICHPHNPSGRVWNEEELLKMAEISRKHNVLMVTDEVHCDIIRKDVEFKPMMSVVGTQGIIALTAINKTFNLAGLSMSSIIVCDDELKKGFEHYFALPSPFGIAAGIAAYNEGGKWVDELNEYLDKNLEFADTFIKEKLPKAKCLKPEGSYIIWIDFSGYGLTDEEIQTKIFDEAKVVLQGGANFDASNQYQRVCLSSPYAMIKEAFERIAKAFENC